MPCSTPQGMAFTPLMVVNDSTVAWAVAVSVTESRPKMVVKNVSTFRVAVTVTESSVAW